MKGGDYNVALFVFFVPYILFEVPSNIIIKRVAPSTYLSGIMILWGKTSVFCYTIQYISSSNNRHCHDGTRASRKLWRTGSNAVPHRSV